MLNHRLAAALCVMTVLACDARGTPDATHAIIAEAGDEDRALFVTPPTSPDAQIVFVGQDESVMPAGRTDAVFVPFATFSIERDGIPNEFPAPDSMAGLLGAAGVHGGDVVLVGDPIPVGRAFAAFDYLGLGDRAAVLDGGPAALTGADAGAVGTGAVGAADNGGAQLEIDPRTDMIVDAAWVHARLDDPDVAILDEAELRRTFTDAGVEPGDTIVAYCRTGGQASFLYTVARHLGYDVRLYDGSYIDWSRTEYPVER